MDKSIVLHRLRTLIREITMMNESVFQESLKDGIFEIHREIGHFGVEKDMSTNIKITIQKK